MTTELIEELQRRATQFAAVATVQQAISATISLDEAYREILCAVDTFDALISKRAYREPLEPWAALEHLHVDAGKQFDPCVYHALVRVITKRLGINSKTDR